MKVIYVMGILLLSICVPVAAQNDSSIDINLKGGVVFPNSPDIFHNYWRVGFNGEIGPSVTLFPSLRIVASVGVNMFMFDSFGFRQHSIYRGRSDVVVQGRMTHLYSGTVGIQFIPVQLSKLPQPYIYIGGGYSNYIQGEILIEEMVFTDDDVFIVEERIEEVNINAPLMRAGIGVDIPVSRSPVLFFEGRYNISLTEDASTNFISLNLGLRFQLR